MYAIIQKIVCNLEFKNYVSKFNAFANWMEITSHSIGMYDIKNATCLIKTGVNSTIRIPLPPNFNPFSSYFHSHQYSNTCQMPCIIQLSSFQCNIDTKPRKPASQLRLAMLFRIQLPEMAQIQISMENVHSLNYKYTYILFFSCPMRFPIQLYGEMEREKK